MSLLFAPPSTLVTLLQEGAPTSDPAAPGGGFGDLWIPMVSSSESSGSS